MVFNNKKYKGVLVWILFPGIFISPLAISMAPLDDAEMSMVIGKDGIFIEIDSATGLSADQLRWEMDSGAALPGACSGGVANQHACTLVGGIALEGVGGPLRSTMAIDIGGDGAGDAALAISSTWDSLRIVANSITHQTAVTPGYGSHSLGSLAYYSTGDMSLANVNGLFDASGTEAIFELNTVGDIIYRQGGPGTAEISFGNFNFGGYFSSGAASGHTLGQGTLGIDGNGLILYAPYSVLDLNFDLLFKAAPTNFDTTGREPMILFGWQGGLRDALIRISGGGVGYGLTPDGNYYDISGVHSSRSEGLNILAEWDYDEDYKWILGQAGGNRTQIWFYDWVTLGGTSPPPGPAFSMPIILDVLQNNVGPAGLCFGGGAFSGRPTAAHCGAIGGEFVTTLPGVGDSAMMVMIHDAHNYAYNSKVGVIDPGPGLDPLSPDYRDDFDWSLIYTWGKFDADIMIRPEGPTGNVGWKSDVALAIQSPGAWQAANSANPVVRATAGSGWKTNTHFALADTGVTVGPGCSAMNPCHQGIGVLNADLLWSVRDFYIQVRADGAGTNTPSMPGGLWLETNSAAQYRFRGMFGGGNFKNLAPGNTSVLALLDVNLSTDRFLFVLSPGDIVGGDAPLRFDGILDFDGSAYFSLAEISSPQSEFRLYDVEGRIGWSEGKILLQSGNNTVDGLPRLTIENELRLGQSAAFGGPPGDPLVARVGFGQEEFGRIAMPAGVWHNEVTLKIP